MGIKIYNDGQLYCPVLVCEVCDEPITKKALGMYVYSHNNFEKGQFSDAAVVHKGDCDRVYEYNMSGDTHMPWGEMRELLSGLVINSGVPPSGLMENLNLAFDNQIQSCFESEHRDGVIQYPSLNAHDYKMCEKRGLAHVYGLVDPVTEEIRYIGKTTRIDARYKQHCDFVQLASHGGNAAKYMWVCNLRKKYNDIPDMVIIECVASKGNPVRLTERENHWIAFGLDHEWPLLNIEAQRLAER